jgi:hypothetical protein
MTAGILVLMETDGFAPKKNTIFVASFFVLVLEQL